jgi:hypothetical protein
VPGEVLTCVPFTTISPLFVGWPSNGGYHQIDVATEGWREGSVVIVVVMEHVA